MFTSGGSDIDKEEGQVIFPGDDTVLDPLLGCMYTWVRNR